MNSALNSKDPIAAGKFLAKLGRPQNILYSGLLAFLNATLNGQPWLGLRLYVLLACLYNLAAGYNNLQDIAIDRRNRNFANPMITQAANLRLIRDWFIVNIIIILGLQIWLPQPGSLILTILGFLLLWAYSHPRSYIQGRGYWSTVLLSFFYGTFPILLAGSSMLTPQLFLLAALQLPLLGASLLAKDYKDEVGDRLAGKRTPLVSYGARHIRLISRLCLLVASIGLLLFAAQVTTDLFQVGITGLALLVYGLGVERLHQRRGKVTHYFRRLPQLVLLLINCLLINALPG